MSSMISSSPIRRIFEEAFNLGNLAVIDEVTSPNLFAHNVIAGTPNGPQGLKLLVSMFRTAFPDLRCTVDDELIEGDKFSARWTFRGTNHGHFMGNPPTGISVNVAGLSYGRTQDGKVVEDWTLIDQVGMLQQLGLIPPPSAK